MPTTRRTKPTAGKQAGRQAMPAAGLNSWGIIGGNAGILLSGYNLGNGCSVNSGSSVLNPLGLPHWGSQHYGSHRTYRWMLDCPKIRHARSIILNPILAADWEVVKADDSAPDERVEAVKKYIVPQRRKIIEGLFRGVDYGHYFGEEVWGIRDGLWVPTLRDLWPDITTIVTDKSGDFIGLSQRGEFGSQQFISDDGTEFRGLSRERWKAFLYTYDGEAGNLWGRGRLENVRYSWTRWLDVAQQLEMLGRKISGMFLIGYVPAGGFDDPATGEPVTYRQMMETSVAAMVNGASAIVLENLALEAADAGNNLTEPELAAKLASASLMKVDKIDFGDQAGAITGLLAELRHWEDLIFEGMLRSARTGSESLHGSKADAMQHTDTGKEDSLLLAGEFDDAVSRQLVDDFLEVKDGIDARGTVKVFTPPFDDPTVNESRSVLNQLGMADKTTAKAITIYLGDAGMKELVSDADLTINDKGLTWEEALQEAEKADAPPPPAPGANGQPVNGNGVKVKGRAAQAINRISKLMP